MELWRAVQDNHSELLEKMDSSLVLMDNLVECQLLEKRNVTSLQVEVRTFYVEFRKQKDNERSYTQYTALA